MPPAWIPANKAMVRFSHCLMLPAAGYPRRSAYSCFIFPMKTKLTFVRPSACALAAAALLQTAAFAAPIDAADTLPITVVTAGRF